MLPRALLLCLGLALGATATAADVDQAAEQALAAAEAAMNVGNDRQSESFLSRIPSASLNANQMARSQIVRAEISLKRNQPMSALQALPSGSDHVPLLAERIEELRGTALFLAGDPVAGTRSLVLREHYLQGDPAAVTDNREQIWSRLMRTPPGSSDASKFPLQDSITRGWVELALLAQQGPAARYEEWLSRYARHPAATRVASLRSSPRPAAAAANAAAPATALPTPLPQPNLPLATTLSALPSQPAVAAVPVSYAASGGHGYALLLPMTGPYASTGVAVRDGFMTAVDRTTAANVRVYDTGASPSQALSAYQSAVADGAAVIVGPLTRNAVSAIAHQGAPPIAVVALNTVEGASASGNLLQFGLAPEDEARAAAEQAMTRNLRRAIVLVPRGEWGTRVAAAFGDRLRELGGTVLASDSFEPGTPDPSKIISHLVGQDASESRHKALGTVVGQTEFDPRRRGDLDFIFLAARPGDSRVILPQLRFFRVGGLPVYSTSLIYEGKSGELGSMRVCDMPWMLETQGNWASLRGQAGQQFPASMHDYPRLVALGADAYRVASRLQAGTLRSNEAMEGASGRLTVGSDGKVSRSLSCETARNINLPAAPAPAPDPAAPLP